MIRYLTMMCLMAGAWSVQALELELPVECELGRDCIIQNYVDQAQGVDWQDYQCRKLSYDKHKGTDFRMAVYREGNAAIKVLAAADGVVMGVRDGEADIHMRRPEKGDISGKECGNGLIIRHEGGWQTQYCHLQQGSVSVASGQTVKAGEVLGRIGLSGSVEFPHVHMSVRDPEGVHVDPFNVRPMETGCSSPAASLWSDKAKALMNTDGTGLLTSGIATQAVDIIDLVEGRHNDEALAADAPIMVFWTLLYGVEEGDVLSLILRDAQGKALVTHTDTVKKYKVQYMQFIGKKRTGQGAWPAGDYQGIVTLKRAGDTLVNDVFDFAVR